MNNHIKKIGIYFNGIYKQLKSIFLELPKNRQIAVIALITIFLFGIAYKFTQGNTKLEEAVKISRNVTTRKVSDLSNKESSVPLIGTVTSTSEATIRSESSGKLTKVYKRLGDYVYAGQIIAEFENGGERAQLQQAEGVYDAAKVSRDIVNINSDTAVSAASDSKTNAINAISSAYITMDDVIRTKTDSAFSNPRDINIKFIPVVPDDFLIRSLESSRTSIEKMLVAREARNKTLTSSDNLDLEILTVQKEVETIKSYLNDMATAYSKALSDNNYSLASLEASKISINTSRSIISATLSSLTNAKTALTASINAETVTGKESKSGSIGAADAQIKQALGAYNGALSRLEKTIIRSPITGTLNSLNIQTGDFITQFSEVAVVSNNGALEVLSYVTEEDAKRITVGSEVMVDSTVKGMITRIAPALDPRTKKIEVRIGIQDNKASLTNGQSVRVTITKNTKPVITSSDIIKIPISALKLTPDGAFVFTVTASSTLKSIPVQEGAILGEEIQIISGLRGDEDIVIDARGLKAGMTVGTTTQ
jgi:multidrug efflux pump subunit AcrA (membrane-fusion protein)